MGWSLVETDPLASSLDIMFGFPRTTSIIYKSGSVREWDGITNTSIDNNMTSICQFGGDVYTSKTSGGGTRSIAYRYNESPFDFTSVDDPGTGSAPWVQSGVRALYDGSKLIHVVGRITNPSTMLLRSSSDGSSWSTDTVTDGLRVQHVQIAATPFGDFAVCRRNSDSHDYFFKRGGSDTWTVSGTDLTAAGYLAQNHYGTGYPALVVRRTSDDVIMYSQDSSVTWNATSLTSVGGTRVFGWAVGASSYLFASTDDELYQWNESTNDFDYYDDNPPGTVGTFIKGLCLWAGKLYAAAADDIYEHDSFSYSVSDTDFSVGGLTPQSMDASPDDVYLYVATLLSGNPVLLRLPADLSADPTKVYEPGAGTAINVKCADLNEPWVWIAGDFGTPVVRFSEDDGTTWVTKDPGTWNGTAQPIVVGPFADSLVLVPTDGDDDLFETEDGGLVWNTLNSSLPFDVGAMARLDINLDEILIGDRNNRNIRYSPNNGAEFHDITSGSMSAVAITDLIVG